MPNFKVNPSVPVNQWLELPLVFQHVWDAWPVVDGALQSLESGMFLPPAMMADAMLADDRIVACASTRINALLGSELEFVHPYQDEGESLTGQAEDVAAIAKRFFPRMCPNAALADLWRWGRMLGVGPAQNVWEQAEGMWMPTVNAWHTENLTYRWDTRSYWITTLGQVDPASPTVGLPSSAGAGSPSYFEIKPGNGQWILYTPFREKTGWMHGLIRPLARLWLGRQFNLRDWSRWGERNALGVTKAYVPADADGPDKATFLSQLSNMASEPTILLPRPPTGNENGYDVEMLEATSATNWQSFREQQKQWDINIAVVWLGQNLTTEVNGGSRAAAQVHENVRRDYLKEDAQSLGECIYQQVLRPWALYNFGDADLAPFPKWNVSPPEDKKDIGTFHNQVSQAILNYKTAGAPVDVRALLDGLAVPLLDEGVTPEPMPVQPGQEPAGPNRPGDEPDPNDKPIDQPVTHARKRGTMQTGIPLGLMNGQLFADGLAENSKRDAKKKLAPMVAQVMSAVKGSMDYESAKVAAARVLGPSATTKDVAKVVERALVLAAMAGRLAAKQDM